MTKEQIEQKALELFPVREKLNKKATGSYDPNMPRRNAYIQGAMDTLALLNIKNNNEDNN